MNSLNLAFALGAGSGARSYTDSALTPTPSLVRAQTFDPVQ